MLDKLTTAVTDLPTIVQGALGSGLFALLFWIGQRTVSSLNSAWAQSSKARQIKYLTDEIAKLRVVTSEDDSERALFLGILIYRSLKCLFKAMIFLCMGLLLSSVDAIFGPLAYFFSLYFLFSGLNTVRTPKVDPAPAERLIDLEKQREALRGA